jgi:hypothetical protein
MKNKKSIDEAIMKKISDKILNLPPYISTSWKNVSSLHMKQIEANVLVVTLHNGSVIEIPDLDPELIKQVFSAHGTFLEKEPQEQTSSLRQFEGGNSPESSFSIGIPFQLGGEGNALDNFGSLLHHNSEQSNSPDLPPEILQKIAGMSKALGMDFEKMSIPKAEPHCNCTYCQITRAIQAGGIDLDENHGEEVSEEDLKFRDWDIKQKSDELYEVTNPIDENEHYQVYLGNPVGCTCGKKNCEHIRTVLSS